MTPDIFYLGSFLSFEVKFAVAYLVVNYMSLYGTHRFYRRGSAKFPLCC